MNDYLPHTKIYDQYNRNPKQSNGWGRAIFRNVRLIVGVALFVTLAGAIYAMSVPRLYETNMLIQVQRPTNLSGSQQAEAPAAAEVEILRSRSVVFSAVDALQLDINIEPKYFPIVGRYIANTHTELSLSGLSGYGGYAWGGEKLDVAVFRIPANLLLSPFVLTVVGKDSYTISQEKLKHAITGKVGEKTTTNTQYGEIQILISGMYATPGVRFIITQKNRSQTIERLQRSLAISETARMSNIIRVSLRGTNPEQISRIVNKIGAEYIRQRMAQKSEDAKKLAGYYSRRLDEVKQISKKLDARSVQILRAHGISDLGEDARSLAQQAIALQIKLAETQQKKVELASRFGNAHPAILLANRQLQETSEELARTMKRREILSGAEREMLAVTREKQLNSDGNADLITMRERSEALIYPNDADARIVDYAETPLQPVNLQLSTRLALAAFLGVLMGIIASILKNTFAADRSTFPGGKSA